LNAPGNIVEQTAICKAGLTIRPPHEKIH